LKKVWHFVLLLGCCWACRPDDSARNTSEPPAADTLQQLTGMLQSSGLQGNGQERIGYTDLDFQLLSQESYFLTGHDSLEAFWGQCLSIRGRVLDLPDSLQLYGRKLFRVHEIHPQPYSYCHFSDTTHLQPPAGVDKEVLQGKIIRHKRPAPDIAYDYALLPAQALRDPFNQIDPEAPIRELPLFPINFLVLQKVENAVLSGQTVALKGWRLRGYAEQLSFQLEAIEPLQ
jgi:hypothetical protein